MNREDKRGIFFGVVGVLTLIVAIIGASLAYFSISARSSDDAVTVQAATVKITYTEGDKINVNDLIPSSKDVAFETYTRYLGEETYTVIDPETEQETQVAYEKCKDDNKRTVCGVYTFEVANEGEDTVSITAKVVPTALDGATTFTNLSWALYDVTNVTDETSEFGNQVATGTVGYSEFNLLSAPAPVTNTTPVKYRLFVWLNDTDLPQNEEQGAMFKGTIVVDVPEFGDKITGTIN